MTAPDVDRDALRAAAEMGEDALDALSRALEAAFDRAVMDYAERVTNVMPTNRALADTALPIVQEHLRDVADALAAAEARADRAEGAIDRALDVTPLGGSVSNLRGVVDEMRRHLAAYREQTARVPEWSDDKPWRCGMHPGERFQVGDRDSGNCSWIRSPRTREQYEKEQNA